MKSTSKHLLLKSLFLAAYAAMFVIEVRHAVRNGRRRPPLSTYVTAGRRYYRHPAPWSPTLESSMLVNEEREGSFYDD